MEQSIKKEFQNNIRTMLKECYQGLNPEARVVNKIEEFKEGKGIYFTDEYIKEISDFFLELFPVNKKINQINTLAFMTSSIKVFFKAWDE